jgi:hypothetical protein
MAQTSAAELYLDSPSPIISFISILYILLQKNIFLILSPVEKSSSLRCVQLFTDGFGYRAPKIINRYAQLAIDSENRFLLAVFLTEPPVEINYFH